MNRLSRLNVSLAKAWLVVFALTTDAWAQTCPAGQVALKDEGVLKGCVSSVNFVGSGASCTRTSSNAAGTCTVSGDTAVAFFNIDAACTSSPCTVTSSRNISSVTRSGTGAYTANFTAALPNNSYVVHCESMSCGANATNTYVTAGGRSTGSMNVNLISAGAVADCAFSCAVFDDDYGPSGVSASTLPIAVYESSATQSMAFATFTQMNFPTSVKDTHSAVSNAGTAWRFTVPAGQDGDYELEAGAALTMGSSVTYDITLSAYLNGAEARRINRPNATTSALSGEVGFSGVVPLPDLAAGDYIEVWLYNANGSSAAKNLSGQAVSNWVSVRRVR